MCRSTVHFRTCLNSTRNISLCEKEMRFSCCIHYKKTTFFHRATVRTGYNPRYNLGRQSPVHPRYHICVPVDSLKVSAKQTNSRPAKTGGMKRERCAVMPRRATELANSPKETSMWTSCERSKRATVRSPHRTAASTLKQLM